MRINEVTDAPEQRLVALSQFLLDRAADQAGKKQISQDAFVGLARSMGINITQPELVDLASRDPLKNIIEPIEPNSGVVRFKGNLEKSTGMTVDQAENIVDKNAKAAMRRGINK
jgi:hypothetical protein